MQRNRKSKSQDCRGEGHVQEDKETLFIKNGEIFRAEVLKYPGYFDRIIYFLSFK